jgi:hypothetical protein
MDSMQRDLEDVAASLRAEIRLEAEEAEREAAIVAGMRRALADVAEELMAHGDTVALDAGGRIFAGLITGVGADLITLQAGSWRVDVATASLARLRVMKRPRVGGVRGFPGHAQSLRARLLELQLEGTLVEVGMAAADEPVVGTVAMVGSDHVAIGEEVAPEWFLPLGSLAYLRVRDLPRDLPR